MRNKSILSFFLVVFSAGLVWPQFYSGYSETDKKTLAEAYYLAGAQYVKVGKTELGKEYENLAFSIYPELAPSQIVEEKQPTAEQLLAQGMAKPIAVPEAMEKPELVPRSFFLRLLGAFLDEDPVGIASFLDGSVYIDDLATEATREEAQEALTGLFSEVSLAGLEPSEVYDLNGMTIVAAPDAVQRAWGQASIIQVNAKMDFSEHVSFWRESQQFFVRKTGTGWYIFAVGANPPPLDWKPKAIPAAAAPVTSPSASPEKEIIDAFTGCLSSFLDKNADGTLSFMANDVRMLRLRQSISRDELATTFQGYFESKDFGNTKLADIVDESSIFVVPTDEFSDEVQGSVYVLNVKAKIDLSEDIPFWTTYQRYYFTREDDAWKIFAVF